MARSFNGTSDYMDAGVLPALYDLTNATLACWASRASTSVSIELGTYVRPYRFALQVVGTTAYWSVENGANSYPNCTFSGTGWHHFALAFNGSLSGDARAGAYIDGAVQTLTSGAGTPAAALPSSANAKAFEVGRDDNAPPTTLRYFGGTYDHIGIWDVTLTADEIASLAKGFSPLLIRRGSLKHYWRFEGNNSPEIDAVGGVAGTLTGTSKADGSRVFMPSLQQFRYGVTAASGGLAANPLLGGGAAINPIYGMVA